MQEFVEWFSSLEAQKLIGQLGVEEFCQPLFIPDSEEWRETQGK